MARTLAIQKTLLASLLLAAAAFPQQAAAITLGFNAITANNVAAVAAGQSQLSVDVTAVGSNQVMFQFFNAGPAVSSLQDIYFDDNALLSSVSPIITGIGASFGQGAAPPNLPSGNTATPPFVVTSGLSFDANMPGNINNGVQNTGGESVSIILSLLSGKTFSNVLADLNSGNLRLGLHVQGFAGGYSEAFVNNPPSVVPEPSTLLLLGTGLGAVCGFARRRFRKQ